MGECVRAGGDDRQAVSTPPESAGGGVPSAVTLIFGAPRAMRAIRALGLLPAVVTIAVDRGGAGEDALADALLRDLESLLVAHELACRIGAERYVALLGAVGPEHAVGRAHELRGLLAGVAARRTSAAVALLADDDVDRAALMAAIERGNAAIAATADDALVALADGDA
jgi:hypothetical protein